MSDKTKLTVMIPVEIDESLRAFCYFENVPLSTAVTNAIAEYVHNRELERGKKYRLRKIKLSPGRPPK